MQQVISTNITLLKVSHVEGATCDMYQQVVALQQDSMLSQHETLMI